MPQYINTNIASLTSQRNLNGSQSALTTALARLSSGMRINSAKDDAAGQGIADRFTSQIKGLNQAVRNANDGISLSQTAEGALNTVTDNLQRMRELAVQSANSTNKDIDRSAIQAETSQLIQEIDRVSNTTEFNGVKLLDGSFTSQQFQVGANAGQTISVSMGSAKSDKLGGGTAADLSATGSANELKEGDLVLNGVVIGGSQAASDNASTSNASTSAIAKAAAINAKADASGVKATVNANELRGNTMVASSGAQGITLTINGVSLSAVTLSSTDTATSRATVVQAINAKSGQTGVTAVDTKDDKSGITLVAADGRNIAVTVSSSGGLATSDISSMMGISGLSTSGSTTYGSITLVSNKDINVQTTTTGDLSRAGLLDGTYKAQTAYVTSNDGNSSTTATDLASGDVKINGVLIGGATAASDGASTTNASASAIAKAAAINTATKDTGVTATANINTAKGTVAMAAASTSGLSATITLNGVSITNIALSTNSTNDNRIAVASAINAKSGQTGVVAVNTNDDTQGIRLVSADGRNISVTLASSGTAGASNVNMLGIANASSGGTTTYGTVSLTSAKQISVAMGSSGNGTAGLAVDVGTYGKGKTGQSLSSVDLSTVDGANKALIAIDNALATINSQRGELGATQNRFGTTIANLATTSENLTASRSRIQDADFAAETANLTRAQILQQAGTAMLAQANQLPQGVLSLLRG